MYDYICMHTYIFTRSTGWVVYTCTRRVSAYILWYIYTYMQFFFGICVYSADFFLRWYPYILSRPSFAKETYTRDYILQKRPIVLRSLLIVATPYLNIFSRIFCDGIRIYSADYILWYLHIYIPFIYAEYTRMYFFVHWADFFFWWYLYILSRLHFVVSVYIPPYIYAVCAEYTRIFTFVYIEQTFFYFGGICIYWEDHALWYLYT